MHSSNDIHMNSAVPRLYRGLRQARIQKYPHFGESVGFQSLINFRDLNLNHSVTVSTKVM